MSVRWLLVIATKMETKRKVKIITSVLASKQNSLAYPECRKEKDAQKEQLNRKLNRILVSSKMEIAKQNSEFDQRFKFKLDEIEREMKKTRDCLMLYQKKLCYSRHMTEWFNDTKQKSKPVNIRKYREGQRKIGLPDINIDKSNLIAKQRQFNSTLKTDEGEVEVSKEEDPTDHKDCSRNEEGNTQDEKKKGAEYEIKFLSDRAERKEKRISTFLQRNYKRNKERILFSYLIEKKRFQQNHTKYHNERMELAKVKSNKHSF